MKKFAYKKHIAMTTQELITVLNKTDIPLHLPIHIKALWYAHHGHWEEAHELVQLLDDVMVALIHGYLHHMEGDHWNGDYWYRKSGFQVPTERDQQWNFILEQVALGTQNS